MVRFWRSDFMIALRNWEHWPNTIIQLPVYPYYLWLSLKARSFSFFSSCNPGIAMGGLLGESKYEILKKLPEQLTPLSVLVSYPADVPTVLKIMKENLLEFPVIFKPDMGEGGWMVEKILGVKDVDSYLSNIKTSFIIQEFVDEPLEFGVFYRRFPYEKHGKVISVTRKKFLSVTGDGQHTLGELILQSDRAKLHRRKLNIMYANELGKILENGQEKILVQMGNHIQGATFYNANVLIRSELHDTFDRICQSIDGFYYGRFDIRCRSIEDLYRGNIRILELNGCGASPSHVFEPGKPFFRCAARLLKHWKDIYSISMMNKQKGFQPIPDKEAWQYFLRFMRTVGR